MKNAATFLIVVFALGACQAPNAVQDDAADMQRAVAAVPQNYKQVIAQKIKESVKDPYSIRSAEISAPAPGFVGLVRGGNQPVVCARFNSKNSFGAYTGVKDWAFIFQNGQLTDMIPEGAMACQNRIYALFPELEKLN